jgi:hypothetical protein
MIYFLDEESKDPGDYHKSYIKLESRVNFSLLRRRNRWVCSRWQKSRGDLPRADGGSFSPWGDPGGGPKRSRSGSGWKFAPQGSMRIEK